MFLLKNVSLFSFSLCSHLEDGIHLLRLSGNVIPGSGTAWLAVLLPVNRWSLDSARTNVSRQGRVWKYAHMLFKVLEDTNGLIQEEDLQQQRDYLNIFFLYFDSKCVTEKTESLYAHSSGLLLKGHSTSFEHEDQFTHHEENYSACQRHLYKVF